MAQIELWFILTQHIVFFFGENEPQFLQRSTVTFLNYVYDHLEESTMAKNMDGFAAGFAVHGRTGQQTRGVVLNT